MSSRRSTGERDGLAGDVQRRPADADADAETQPLLGRRASNASQSSHAARQLSTRHAFAILVTLQIGSGIFASPSQVDSNVPSPGAALIVWSLGGLLSWAGAASFAELGAALPLNGGMQAYLAYVYGDTMAFLMAWIYIMAAKPSALAINSFVVAEYIGFFSSSPLPAWLLKLIAALTVIAMVLINSINTKTTLRLSESFTGLKLFTVFLIVIGGLNTIRNYLVHPNDPWDLSPDWHSKNWFASRPSYSEGNIIDWTNMGAWERLGHYSAAIYGGLWAFDGWDNANIVGSEVKNPGQALPKAIKAAMVVVLISYELVNVAYYIMLPWSAISGTDTLAVSAIMVSLGYWGAILVSVLVALSCAGSITSNIFAIGRLTVAAAERGYLPAFLGQRGLGGLTCEEESGDSDTDHSAPDVYSSNFTAFLQGIDAHIDAPIYANLLLLALTVVYICMGSFRTLLTFVGMAMWVFYVSTVVGLIILRRREPDLHRPYKPPIVLPYVFVIAGTFIIIRSAIFAPVQAGVLVSLLVVGTLVSRLQSR